HPRLSRLREPEVLVDDQFGYRKTVVNFCHADVLARFLDADLIVDLFCGSFGFGENREVKVGIQSSDARSNGQTQTFYGDKVLVESWCKLGSSDDRSSRSVSSWTAIQQPARCGNR